MKERSRWSGVTSTEGVNYVASDFLETLVLNEQHSLESVLKHGMLRTHREENTLRGQALLEQRAGKWVCKL